MACTPRGGSTFDDLLRALSREHEQASRRCDLAIAENMELRSFLLGKGHDFGQLVDSWKFDIPREEASRSPPHTQPTGVSVSEAVELSVSVCPQVPSTPRAEIVKSVVLKTPIDEIESHRQITGSSSGATSNDERTDSRSIGLDEQAMPTSKKTFVSSIRSTASAASLRKSTASAASLRKSTASAASSRKSTASVASFFGYSGDHPKRERAASMASSTASSVWSARVTIGNNEEDDGSGESDISSFSCKGSDDGSEGSGPNAKMSTIRVAGLNDCGSSFDDFDGQILLQRMQVRLDITYVWEPITGASLHVALQNLSVYHFSIQQLQELIIGIVDLDKPKPAQPKKRFSLFSRASSHASLRSSTSSSRSSQTAAAISFAEFSRVLLLEKERSRLESSLCKRAEVVKEILASGETLFLIADVMGVHVEELTQSDRVQNKEDILEQIVGLMISINGVSLGLQSDSGLEAWPGWRWTELAFTVFFLSEMIFRICTTSFRQHFTGVDWSWNAFDAMIVMIAIVDTLFTFVTTQLDLSSFTVLRVFRLTRLTRLIRLFRVKALRELSSMVKGLLAGMQTLMWAVILLFFFIYVVSVFTTVLMGTENKVQIIQDEELFTSVPRSIITVFRCFTADCVTSQGFSISKLLADGYGFTFVLAYMATMLIVTFGLFNLIMALYIENALGASKKRDMNVSEEGKKLEALRIARVTKSLMSKFHKAYDLAMTVADTTEFGARLSDITRASQLEGDNGLLQSSDIKITKELFAAVIKDAAVSFDLDELEVPSSDRIHLFDVIDANGSGALEADELVLGLLKVRSDNKQSDGAACLLSVRSLHDSVRELSAKQDQLIEHFNIIQRRKTFRMKNQSMRSLSSAK